jgi:transcriptional regulator with XRE-family HTH domain
MNERDTEKKEFAARFNQILLTKGYEHKSLAELKILLGVSRTLIHNWKSGKHIPSLHFAGIISSVFDISFEWLMTGNGTIDGFIMRTPDELALISKYRDLSEEGKQKTINFIFTECVEYEITVIQKKANAEKQATLKLIT